jgi:membrane associated rhomboid family serine protease/Zn-finger nucleic acid-binding protein
LFFCPRCKEALYRKDTTWGLAFRCGQCNGWLMASPVLRNATTAETVERLWIAARQSAFNRGCMCPICGISTRKVPPQLTGAPSDLDVCLRCQVVWLDGGELESLPHAEAANQFTDAGRVAGERSAHAAGKTSPWSDEIGAATRAGAPRPGVSGLSGFAFIGAMLGMPVELDQPTTGPKPWVTWVAMGLSVFLSLMFFTQMEQAVAEFAFVPADPWRSGGLTLFSPFFIHGGWMHLIGNMLFLFAFGDNVEHRVGPLRMLVLLALATAAGNLAQMWLDPQSTIPLIGASGGISGVLAYYALAFPKARLGMLIFFHLAEVPVLLYMGFWVLMQFLTAAQQVGQEGGGVAWMAHLGGAAAGLLFFFFTKPQIDR